MGTTLTFSTKEGMMIYLIWYFSVILKYQWIQDEPETLYQKARKLSNMTGVLSKALRRQSKDALTGQDGQFEY